MHPEKCNRLGIFLQKKYLQTLLISLWRIRNSSMDKNLNKKLTAKVINNGKNKRRVLKTETDVRYSEKPTQIERQYPVYTVASNKNLQSNKIAVSLKS